MSRPLSKYGPWLLVIALLVGLPIACGNMPMQGNDASTDSPSTSDSASEAAADALTGG